jgi:hypothetical protein
MKELGDRHGTAAALFGLGLVAHSEGGEPAARALFRESLILRRELADRHGTVELLEALALLASEERSEDRRASAERAARLFGAAEAQRQKSGLGLSMGERADHDRGFAECRSALGEAALAAMWAQGQAMTWEQAIADALETGS